MDNYIAGENKQLMSLRIRIFSTKKNTNIKSKHLSYILILNLHRECPHCVRLRRVGQRSMNKNGFPSWNIRCVKNPQIHLFIYIGAGKEEMLWSFLEGSIELIHF